MRPIRWFKLPALLCLASLALSGCAQTPKRSGEAQAVQEPAMPEPPAVQAVQEPAMPEPPAAQPAQEPTEHHSTTGEIKAILDGGTTLVIDHGEFKGFMAAMTMPFKVADPDIARDIKVGDKVQFTISKFGPAWQISKIEKTGN